MKITIPTDHVPIIANSTIASNMLTLPTSSKLSCTVVTGSTTLPYTIDCTNVGALTTGSYWIAVSVAFPSTTNLTDLSKLGGIKFTQ